MNKNHFVDIGIRNAVLNDFNPIALRNDTGALWENFLYMERTKKLDYDEDHAMQYFWRKYSGTEIDFLETKDGNVWGYELKWNKEKLEIRACLER